jgi:alpha-glucosidase
VPIEESVLSKLTYTPGNNYMPDKSLSLDGKHSDGQTELNYHSLFGFMQGIISHKYFEEKNMRPFIISRSTFVGQGKYTSHWLGDNFSGFDYLKYSIPGVYSMNLFGINFVGPDICGFIGDTTDNLCQKWSVLGAFYPFARNHNAIGNRDQEPYRFSEEIQKNMKQALLWRYALLRYYYTQLYQNSIEGGMFWKPLFFDFPEVEETYKDLETNILLGSALKLSAVISEEDHKTQNYIFTEGIWCDIVSYKCTLYYSTQSVSLPATPDSIRLHLREGHILPIQRSALNGVKTTKDLDSMPTDLLISLNDETSKAVGRLMVDDGETYKDPERLDVVFEFEMKDNSHGHLELTTEQSGFSNGATKLGKVQFLGADYTYVYKLTKAKINGQTEVKGTYSRSTKILEFDFQNLDLNTLHTIEFST